MFKNVLIASSIAVLSACSSIQDFAKDYVQQPTVNYKSISVGEVSTNLIEINPTFNVTNNNSFAMPIDDISYQLALNNEQLLSGQTEQIGTLPANSDKDVTLSLGLTQDTLTAMQQLLLTQDKVDYQIKGSVNTMGVAIPFEQSATLYVPQVSIADLEVINADFDKLDIVLTLAVDNKNDFSLPLDDVDYLVSSNGSDLFNGSLNSQEIEQGESLITLPLVVKPNDLFSNVFALLMNPELPLHFEITSPLFTKTYDQTINLTSLFK